MNIPEGWPTEEMLLAAGKAVGINMANENIKRVLIAGLAAAPTPPVHYENQPDGTITPVDPADMGIGAIAPSAAEVEPVTRAKLEYDDYGYLWVNSTITSPPHPANDGLRKAAEDACKFCEGCALAMEQMGSALPTHEGSLKAIAVNLRVELEKKS